MLRRPDWVTYNGPSCKQLLLSLGADGDRMSSWDYAADPRKPYTGELILKPGRDSLRLLTVGQLSERKGMLPAIEQLSAWAEDHPQTQVQWNVLGTGPLEPELRQFQTPKNLHVILHGHCEPQSIAEHYRDNNLMLLPTMADEWGLVVDESMFSGLPVIGSCHSQAVSTMIENQVNGLVYDPELPASLGEALDQLLAMSDQQYEHMPSLTRQTVAERTPQTSADQLVKAIRMAAEYASHAEARR